MSCDSSGVISDDSHSSPESSFELDPRRKRRHLGSEDDNSSRKDALESVEVWSEGDDEAGGRRSDGTGEVLDWVSADLSRREDHKRRRNGREEALPAPALSPTSSLNAFASGSTSSYSFPQSIQTPVSRLPRSIHARPSFTSPTSHPTLSYSASSSSTSSIALPDYSNPSYPHRRRVPSSSLPLSLRRPPLIRNASAVPDPAPFMRTSRPANTDSSYFQSLPSSSSLAAPSAISSRALGHQSAYAPPPSETQPTLGRHAPWLGRRPGSLDSSGRLRGPSRVANEQWLEYPRDHSQFSQPSLSISTAAASSASNWPERSWRSEFDAGDNTSGEWPGSSGGRERRGVSSSFSSTETRSGSNHADRSLPHLEAQRSTLSPPSHIRRSSTLEPRWLSFGGSPLVTSAETDITFSPSPSPPLHSSSSFSPASHSSSLASQSSDLHPHSPAMTMHQTNPPRNLAFEQHVGQLPMRGGSGGRLGRRSNSPASTLRRRGAWQIAEGEETPTLSSNFQPILFDEPSSHSRRRSYSASHPAAPRLRPSLPSIFSPDDDVDSGYSASASPAPFSTSSRLPIMLASGSLGHRSSSDRRHSVEVDSPARALVQEGLVTTLRRRAGRGRQTEVEVQGERDDSDVGVGGLSRSSGPGSSGLANFLSRHEERRRNLLDEPAHPLAAPSMSRTLASSGHAIHPDSTSTLPPNPFPPSVWDALVQNHGSNNSSLPHPDPSSRTTRSILADFPSIFADSLDPSSSSPSSSVTDALAAHEAFSVASLRDWQSRLRSHLAARDSPSSPPLPFSMPGRGSRSQPPHLGHSGVAREAGRGPDTFHGLIQEVDSGVDGEREEGRELSWIEAELARIRRENRELFGESFPLYGRGARGPAALSDVFAGIGGGARPLGDYMMDDELDLSYEGLTALSARIGLGRPSGVSSTIIATLKVGSFGASVEESISHGKTLEEIDSRCAVCYEEYAPEDITLSMNACSHFFHQSCLKEWLSSHSTCPICRSQCRSHAPTELVPEMTESLLDEIESMPLLGEASFREGVSGTHTGWDPLHW